MNRYFRGTIICLLPCLNSLDFDEIGDGNGSSNCLRLGNSVVSGQIFFGGVFFTLILLFFTSVSSAHLVEFGQLE